MLSPGRRGRGRRRRAPLRRRRRRGVRADGAAARLWQRAYTHVLLLQARCSHSRPRYVVGDVVIALLWRRGRGRGARVLATGRVWGPGGTAGLLLATRLVLVVWVRALVDHPQTVSFLDERFLIWFGELSGRWRCGRLSFGNVIWVVEYIVEVLREVVRSNL